MLITGIITTVLLLAVSPPSVANAPAGEMAARRQDESQKAWAEIVRLHKVGVEALAKERANPNDRSLRRAREESFSVAVKKLSTYINTYLTGRGTVTYLREIYRLAIYFELAGLSGSAWGLYLECLQHPLIGREDSVFDGKRISVLARKRFLAIDRRTSSSRVASQFPSGRIK